MPKACAFQPCAFLKLRKMSEIESAVEIFFTETDARRFALQNTCSKQFCGKLPEKFGSALKKNSTSDVSKSCRKVSKKVGAADENLKMYKIFMWMSRLPNGCSIFLL